MGMNPIFTVPSRERVSRDCLLEVPQVENADARFRAEAAMPNKKFTEHVVLRAGFQKKGRRPDHGAGHT